MLVKNDFEKFKGIIYNPENWFKTNKLHYCIQMRKEKLGVNIYNYLENSEYVTSEEKNIVLGGTEREEWVVTNDKILKDYRLDENGTLITLEFLENLKNEPVKIWTVNPEKEDVIKYFALRIPKDISFIIQTLWGESLTVNREGLDHYLGDYLICSIDKNGLPNFTDMWCVNGRIFNVTYDKSLEKDIKNWF